MICPRTKAKCGYLAFCDVTGMCLDDEAIRENPLATPADGPGMLSITADEFAAMARDSERLDWLDDLNKKFNERTGTTYGWKLDWTCNRWALSDCNLPALTVREAIDAAMAERNK